MPNPDSSPLRLLWLDPLSPPVPRLMRGLLRRYGIIVETPPSEEAALDWLEVQNFDLLVVDESIGCREYLDSFLAQANKVQPGLPFAFTGISDSMEVANLPQEGDRSILRKPIVLPEAIISLREWFGTGRIPLEPLPSDTNWLRSQGNELAGLRVLVFDYRKSLIADISRKMIERCGGGGQVDLVMAPLWEKPDFPETDDYDLIFIDRYLAFPDDGWLVRKLMDLPNPPPLCLTGNFLETEGRSHFAVAQSTFALINCFELTDLFDILAACRAGWRSD